MMMNGMMLVKNVTQPLVSLAGCTSTFALAAASSMRSSRLSLFHTYVIKNLSSS
ncbi:Uncharacterised protein [Mycobacteroides abscessus subsp. abscessus]|nr:Uncharacterised protein [Mycobacteroides abscessus subsp. abscessus]